MEKKPAIHYIKYTNTQEPFWSEHDGKGLLGRFLDLQAIDS